jgi:hypothetical protein
MPYIKQNDRVGARFTPVIAGELNFAITTLVHEWLDRQVSLHDGKLGYDFLNTAIGALECAKLELYRRVAAPYEDRKVIENGDVLPASAS